MRARNRRDNTARTEPAPRACTALGRALAFVRRTRVRYIDAPPMDKPPGADPIAVLIEWHAEARAAGSRDPDAMALGTVSADGAPSVRTVLYKGSSDGRVRFVTNYGSRKAREMDENPRVALTFYWPEILRQVRIEGRASRAEAAESEAYFASRPRESQLGAWASPQSQVIPSRSVLEQRLAEVEERFRGRPVERPPHWGMYVVEPLEVELWLAGPHRLHDRFRYRRAAGAWEWVRLAP